MAKVGLGLRIGRRIVGTIPPTNIDAPPVLIQSGSPTIVVVGAEAMHPANLAALVTSKTVHYSHHADGGFVESGGAGTGVTQFTDLVTSGTRHATASGTARPAATANGGPGGAGYALTFDGTSDGMNIALAVTPGTVPFFRRTLVKLLSGFVTGAQITCGSATNRLGARVTTGPLVSCGNGTNSGSTSVSLNTWYLIDEYYSNSINDFIRVGALSSPAPGTSFGNTAASALGLGARSDAAAAWCPMALAWSFACNGLPTNAELNAQAAWLQTWHGAANISVPTYP